MWNIYRCELCKLHVIADEKDLHICILNIKDIRIEENTKWVFDGKIWYPLKLSPTTNQQPKKTPSDPTEPIIRFC